MHHGVVGVGTHDNYILRRLQLCRSILQRQDAVVLQEHDTLAGHIEGQLLVFLRGHSRSRNLRPRHLVILVEVAHFHTSDEQATKRTVEVGLLDITTAHSLWQVTILRATLHIGTSQNSLSRCLLAVLGGVVPTGQEVANSTTVTSDQPLETPFITQDLLFVACLTATRLTINALIGTHHLGHLALLHQCLEGWQVGLPKVALGQVLHIKRVAIPFWSAMHGEVLGTSQQLFKFA